ncbi:hypothetical protein J2S43_002428 [Catenuloplanes nepalensis]|uniref:Ricin B lectin domain-containing protein n=1 Tax=Catenuloplanes nepalensis TaxID=587533 RepID=A0ABT9MR58_9ACTN|nr:RICIN domain-containing protein [Catenuloplanes nepalensis]MDP9793916.1 hypothetical protein [Catenuloplanes nepalensis]
MRRKTVVALAAVLLGLVAAVMPAGASTATASSTAVSIRNAASEDCLRQLYGRTNQPTTTVWAVDACTYAGEQLWRFEFVGGDTYRVVNNRTGWCLSAPNGPGSEVFAEYCVSPLPDKQKWTPVWTAYGDNVLISVLSGECMSQEPDLTLWVRYFYADGYTPGIHWVWS